ncbi:dUTP diphosphatase [uncultured Mediterranean phage]|nr:dUTP diphosphatase [uncultured Mediterranean phage]
MLLYIVSDNALYKDNNGGAEFPDAGVDLYFPKDITIPAGETVKIDLEIQCAAFHCGTGAAPLRPCSFFLYPRSSIVKTPLRLANSAGIIDSGYRGNIMAVVDNIKDYDYTVKKDQRLFQLCAPNLQEICVRVVETLGETPRGKGGFGSTGK